MFEIENLDLQHPTYWSRNPNIWGSLSDWDIYFIDKVPGCNKREAHRSLSVELGILLDNLPRKNRRFVKASALKKALENCENDSANDLLWKNHLKKLESLAISDRVHKREIKSIAIQEEIGRAEEQLLEKPPEKRKANIEDSKVEERVGEKRQRLTRSMNKQKAESFTDLITNSESYGLGDENEDILDNEQTPSVAPSTVETKVIVESNKKAVQDLLGVKCSENMQLICQYHDKTYPDEILLDLRPNSRFTKELPLNILSPYLKELDDKIENLIPSHIHEFLTQFFKQNLTGEDWHTKIDDLQCQDRNDLLMVSVIRILRRTLPPFIIAFSLGSRNPLLNLETLEKPHLNNFVHPCLQTSLWYISSINYEFGEIRTENHKNQCADGVGYLNTADKYQLVYMEGSRPNADDDKEVADASKIANNLQKIYINVVKDNIKCRRRFPKLCVFGGQSYRLRVYLQFLDYCGGKFRLNEVDNANLPRDFTEMPDFVSFYECIIKWAMLAREIMEGFEESRTQRDLQGSHILVV
ncbi:12196_t:CDS:10 [Ambispora leptoticha]|uniref:12196_t:CDS:1 n=1 Tax=Ambispora leptoticha TaxID=144679 RepID=A0A9N9F6B0_9GLOM|nr:12196_t:CDS:10 [Ambispora leptoticha]